MQYVKNHRLYAVADTAAERDAAVAETLDRKLDDVRNALALEQRLSKRQILSRYLDAAYFGNAAYGVTAAARTYFGVTPGELTLPQAALLAGLIRSPGTYDPVAAPQAAAARRAVVLDAMVATGTATPAEAAAAAAAPLGVRDPLASPAEGCTGAAAGTGFFCRYLLDHLVGLGLPVERLREGGYTITTTLDPAVTAAAQQAAREQVPVAETSGIANAVAIVAPGAEEHRVLALAANRELGPDAAAGQTAYPLPSEPVPFGAGSIYKIFTAAAALERGIVAMDSTLPSPPTYTSEVYRNGTEPYTVSNGGTYPSSMTLREALAESPNTAFLALADQLGSVDPIVDMAYRLGLRQSLQVRDAQGRTVAEAVLAEQRASYTLGPEPTSPLELANVAATLVSGGVWCPPIPVVAVTDRTGAAVALPRAGCEQVISRELAQTLVAGLSDVHTSGTAAGAADAAGWTGPMIGKTGTTQHSISAGFVGATPQLAAAVITWSDAAPPSPVCTGNPPTLCSGGDLSGGSVPARTWFAAMQPLHAG
jgi:membrane peptidoglycan carboxypeptidase